MINKLNIINEQLFEDKPLDFPHKREERSQKTTGTDADHEQQSLDVATTAPKRKRQCQEK